MSQISSFDIFDTVLTRLVIDPTEIFKICGDRALQNGWINFPAEIFRDIRINAENRCRIFYEGGEVNLDEIYNEIANTLELKLDIVDKLKQLELTIEIENLVAIPQAHQLLDQARRSHPNILFLSDMYLSAEFLKERLKQHLFWREGDIIYVSSQWRKSKGRGDLFLKAIESLGIGPKELTYTGNNWRSDIVMPSSLGIQAIYFNDANPNRYELTLQKYAKSTNGITSQWAGISRYTRLNSTAKNIKESTICDVAACVAAPILTAYTTWILQQAKARKLSRIYFLARDGEILLQIAQELKSKVYPEVELRYLYVSRQALRMPGLTKINNAFWGWMFDDTDVLTIDSLIARMCLDPQLAKPIFEPFGYPFSLWQKNLSPKERVSLRSELEASESLQELVLQIAKQKRGILKTYLEQEKMLDGEAFGLVDIGWRGSLQVSLENAFEVFGTKMPVGFYFALDKKTDGFEYKGEAIAFFFNLNKSIGFRNGIDYRYVSAMEVFCAGCEGTTLDYILREDGIVLPVLKHETNSPSIDWGIKLFQTTVIDFVRNLVGKTLTESFTSISLKLLREALDDLFLTFNNYPTQIESQTFTDCPFFDDPNELYHFYWVMPFRLIDVFMYAIAQRESINVHRNAWYEASLQVSSPLVKALVPIAIFQRKMLKRLKSNLMSIKKRS